MSLETLDWDTELLDIFGVPRDILPEICPSSGRFAVISGFRICRWIASVGCRWRPAVRLVRTGLLSARRREMYLRYGVLHPDERGH